MEPFILALLLVGALIAGGVAVSLYLYTRGVVGTNRSRKSERWQFATEPASEEAMAEDEIYINMGTMTTSDYARTALKTSLTVIVGILLLLAFMIHSMGH